jgi:hypothetical protein
VQKSEEKGHLEDIAVDGIKRLKRRPDRVACFCEHGNEPAGSTKCGNFFNILRKHQLPDR